ncbi:hypothetical protein Nepgr_026807 [Nepenthes gracilis]|uniref:Uncharacterized protein n=1 Tax=Nepenthes gracilis TaxID=150966 RepID=A0AAD3T9P0_NEPGR|nr:hypothetical protein Nepgr_026807 [Nepenthes gracilis]
MVQLYHTLSTRGPSDPDRTAVILLWPPGDPLHWDYNLSNSTLSCKRSSSLIVGDVEHEKISPASDRDRESAVTATKCSKVLDSIQKRAVIYVILVVLLGAFGSLCYGTVHFMKMAKAAEEDNLAVCCLSCWVTFSQHVQRARRGQTVRQRVRWACDGMHGSPVLTVSLSLCSSEISVARSSSLIAGDVGHETISPASNRDGESDAAATKCSKVLDSIQKRGAAFYVVLVVLLGPFGSLCYGTVHFMKMAEASEEDNRAVCFSLSDGHVEGRQCADVSGGLATACAVLLFLLFLCLCVLLRLVLRKKTAEKEEG